MKFLSKIVLLLGDDAAKAMVENMLEHSPNMNKKCHVSRLAFLACLLAIYEMEKNILIILGGVNKHIEFEPALKTAELCRLSTSLMMTRARTLPHSKASARGRRLPLATHRGNNMG
jgi:hypothetical protein